MTKSMGAPRPARAERAGAMALLNMGPMLLKNQMAADNAVKATMAVLIAATILSRKAPNGF